MIVLYGKYRIFNLLKKYCPNRLTYIIKVQHRRIYKETIYLMRFQETLLAVFLIATKAISAHKDANYSASH